MSDTQAPATISELAPLLYVNDAARSVSFYQQLGFVLTARWAPEGQIAWCRLERGRAALMLQQACAEDGSAEGRGRGVHFYFQCNDAVTMHAELSACGLSIAPPQTAFYGMNQIFLSDPDGYQLCFQSVAETAC